ncbi:MAG: Trk system potassium transporter TrkA [Planctomycetaceae bacterium]|nr:Trk system potassium transporter TrkA [Planctomycetaceae bacterium]
MHIVVIGAGTVGTSIAELLCFHRHNVVVVDSARAALDRVEEKLDVRTVHGSGCEAIPLFQAGVQSAELVLAVTDRDELNLVGASLAKAMGARRSVVRIFNPAYRDFSTFDYQRHFRVDRLLSLEQLTALELARGIRAPGLLAIENFARGGVHVLEVAAEPDAKAVGKKLIDLALPKQVRVGLISNTQHTVIPGADDRIASGDHVTLIGQQKELEDVRKLFERKVRQRMDIIIAGGGEVGFHLARALQEERFRIKLLEADAARCEHLARLLPHVTVLNADATLRNEMEEARVGAADAFVAATGRDEDNIICGVEARELGARQILSVVRRPDYANVLEKLGIDIAVSPRQVMAREVLGMLAGGQVVAQSEIAGQDAAVWEVEVVANSPITRSTLRQLPHSGWLIAAIVRDEIVWVASGDDQLKSGDTAVVLLQRDHGPEVLRMFEPAGARS